MSRAVIAAIAPVDSQERFEGLGVARDPRLGPLHLARPRCRRADTPIRARRFVIATGSRPLRAADPGARRRALPDQRDDLRPARASPRICLILGGGPIGMEMAQAHRRLGCEVTVIEGAKALGRDDPELAAVVLDALRAEGVEILEGVVGRSGFRPRAA